MQTQLVYNVVQITLTVFLNILPYTRALLQAVTSRSSKGIRAVGTGTGSRTDEAAAAPKGSGASCGRRADTVTQIT